MAAWAPAWVVDASTLPSSASLDASLDASSNAKHGLEEELCLPLCTGAVQQLACRCRKQITQISSSHDDSMGLEDHAGYIRCPLSDGGQAPGEHQPYIPHTVCFGAQLWPHL